MRSRLLPILALVMLAALPAAAHTRTLSEPNGVLQPHLSSDVEIESEIALPTIITDAPDTLPVFTRSQKLASGFFGLGAEPNIQRTLDLGQESRQVDDYMHARYYNPNLGRFLSVDPKASSAKLALPQSWNRYSYTRNSPVAFTDPDGRDVYYLDKNGKSSPKLQAFYERAQKNNGRVRAVFSAFAPGTGRDLTIRVGDPGTHQGTGKPLDGATTSVFREATSAQLLAAHTAAGGGDAGTAAAEALMNKGQQLASADVVLSSGATDHTKLHEIGHVEQGLLDPEAVMRDGAIAKNAKTDEEFRRAPTEVYADEFAREARKNR